MALKNCKMNAILEVVRYNTVIADILTCTLFTGETVLSVHKFLLTAGHFTINHNAIESDF